MYTLGAKLGDDLKTEAWIRWLLRVTFSGLPGPPTDIDSASLSEDVQLLHV